MTNAETHFDIATEVELLQPESTPALPIINPWDKYLEPNSAEEASEEDQPDDLPALPNAHGKRAGREGSSAPKRRVQSNSGNEVRLRKEAYSSREVQQDFGGLQTLTATFTSNEPPRAKQSLQHAVGLNRTFPSQKKFIPPFLKPPKSSFSPSDHFQRRLSKYPTRTPSLSAIYPPTDQHLQGPRGSANGESESELLVLDSSTKASRWGLPVGLVHLHNDDDVGDDNIVTALPDEGPLE